ncbi:Calmodulin-binding transcription activator 2 [Nymphaea thermarum]|nr:Calmodulin-binding transcription activator 2 [Nymphaea thermarum]
MADSRRCAVNSQLGTSRFRRFALLIDIGQILLEAQNRWLRPNEVCEILRNYQKFCLTPDPPYKPPDQAPKVIVNMVSLDKI